MRGSSWALRLLLVASAAGAAALASVPRDVGAGEAAAASSEGPAAPDPSGRLAAAGARRAGAVTAAAEDAVAAPTDGSAADDPATVGWVEAVVTGGDGLPEVLEGTVYVLEAGAHGVSDVADVPSAPVTRGGRVRVPVPRAGRYDVGVVVGAASARVEDVVVADGATVEVVLTLPPCAPLILEFPTALPRPPAESWHRVQAHVRPAGGARVATAPGRGERRALRVRVDAPAAGGPVETEPLPLDADVEVVGAVRRFSTGACWSEEDDERDWRLVPTRPTVRGGDRVALRVVRATSLEVGSTGELAGWPRTPAEVRTVLVPLDGQAEVPADRTVVTDAAAWARAPVVFEVLPGRWRVEVSGDGVAADAVEVEVAEDRVGSAVLAMRVDPDARVEATEVVVSGGLFHETAAEDDVQLLLPPSDGSLRFLEVTTTDRDGERTWGPYVHGTRDPSRRRSIPRWYRGDVGLLIAAPDLASRPSPVPDEGPWTPPLERGGFAVCTRVPGPDVGLGAVTVRREDGHRIAVAPPGRPPEFEARARLVEGTRLGPFPPGPLRLVVAVGRVDVGVVRVVVEAGETTSFALPRAP